MHCTQCGGETPPNSIFCLHCGRQVSATYQTVPAYQPPQPKASKGWIAGTIILVILGIGIIATAIYVTKLNSRPTSYASSSGESRTESSSSGSSSSYSISIAPDTIALEPSEMRAYPFSINSSSSMVNGECTAQGGIGND